MGSADKNSENVFILGITSDIGKALAEQYKRNGFQVIGTCRNVESGKEFESQTGIPVIPCDVGSKHSVQGLLNAYLKHSFSWDIFISAVGTMEPAGDFFFVDFDGWEQAVRVNSTAQLRVLHALYPYRRKEKVSHVAFFAGAKRGWGGYF